MYRTKTQDSFAHTPQDFLSMTSPNLIEENFFHQQLIFGRIDFDKKNLREQQVEQEFQDFSTGFCTENLSQLQRPALHSTSQDSSSYFERIDSKYSLVQGMDPDIFLTGSISQAESVSMHEEQMSDALSLEMKISDEKVETMSAQVTVEAQDHSAA